MDFQNSFTAGKRSKFAKNIILPPYLQYALYYVAKVRSSNL